MALEDDFEGALERYPPDYKLIKKQLVDAYAKPHESVWNQLHLELTALELFAIVCERGAQPRQVSQALDKALATTHGNWGHLYQQLLNTTDGKSPESLRQACQQTGIYQPLKLEPARTEPEKLGNVLLQRLGLMAQEMEGGTAGQVAANAIRRGVHSLDAELVTFATQCAGYVDLRDRMFPKLAQFKMPKPDSGPAGGKIKVALVAVLVLLAGGGFFALRDTSSGQQRFEQARQHYQSGDYEAAVSRAESALDALKSEGAQAADIHKLRKFLSSAYYKAGETRLAVEQMEILCRAYPDNTEYRKTLSQLQSEL